MKTFRSRSGRVFWEAALLTTGLVVLLALVSQSLLAIHERDSRAGLREAALLAADTGLRYALARLGADPAWQAPGPLEVPPGEFGFSVREDRGTVQGSRVSSRGTPTRFRIRFHADGDPRAAVQDARGVLSRKRRGQDRTPKCGSCAPGFAWSRLPRAPRRITLAWLIGKGSPRSPGATLGDRSGGHWKTWTWGSERGSPGRRVASP